MSTTRIKTLFFAFLKAIGWGLVSVLALLFFASLIIRLPQVQSIVVSKIENTLKNSLGTELTIGHAYINFPKSIEVKSFYLEDLQSDTLLYFKSLEVNTDLWQLTQRTVEFNTITLSGLRSNIKRAANSEIFNFQFISDAFHSENSSSEIDSEPWSLGVESIKSNDIKIQFQDETSTAYLSTSWNKLDIEIDNLNIQEPKVLINSIFVEGGHIDFDKNESTTPSKKAEGDSSFELNVNEVTIENTKFEFNDTYQTLNGLIGNFQLETQKFSLNENLLVIDLLALENSTIDYRKKTRPINERLEIKNSPNKWLIAANKVQFENNSIQAKLDSSDYDKKFFNPNNFIITNLDVDVNNTFYSSESMKAEIGEVSFFTDDREVLLESKLDLTSTELDLKEIDLYINNTLLQATANASFSSLNSIMSSNTQLKLELSSSELLMSDLSYFIPKVDFSPAPEKVTLSTIIEGSMKQLNIAELSVNTPLSSICFQGTISDLTHPSDLFYSIDTFQINSHRQEMLNFLSDSLNDIITLPDIMDVYIKGQGSLSDYTGSIALNSSYGGINLNDIKVNLRETVPTYSGNIESSGFDFGRLLQQSHFDSLIIDLSVFGQGTSLDNLNTTLKGSLQHIILNEYAYDTLSIEASLNESLIELQINLRDEHAGFSLTGALEDRIGLHKNNLDFQLTKAHLKSLNFSRVPLDIKGRMQTDFTTKNFQGFNGKISIIEFEANNGLDTYKVDSLVVHSLNQEEKTQMNIDSDILAGRFEGNVDLLTVSKTIQRHINNYYDIIEVPNEKVEDINFTFNLDINKTNLITDVFFPQISELDPGTFHAQFSSPENRLDIELPIHHITYKNIAIDSFRLSSHSTENELTSQVSVKELATSNTALQNLTIAAIFADDKIDARFTIDDSLAQTKYNVEAQISSQDSSYQLTIMEDSLVLNYNLWQVKQTNPVVLNNYYSAPATELRIGKDREQLFLTTYPNDSILRLRFDQFDLETISDAMNQEEILAQGELNGQVDFKFINGPGLSADLTIDKLMVLGTEWGNFHFLSKKITDDYYESSLSLRSEKNDLNIQASYSLSDLDNLQLKLDLRKFELSTVEPLMGESIQEINGILTAKATLNNGLSSPNIDGVFIFDQVSFRPTALNNRLTIAKEKIGFSNSRISLKDFVIKDEVNNRAILNGKIELVDLNFYNFDLKLKTEDFLILNTTAIDNELVFGKLITDGEVDLTGSSARPNIDMKLTLSDDSNLTYIVPESEYNTSSSENTVQFVNHKNDAITIEPESIASDSLSFEGLDIAATLQINKGARFNIIVDPVTEDQLAVQGSANLNLDISRKGDLKINGRYTIEEGSYNFSFYKLLKRKFELVKGSTIVWAGDPYDAQLNLKAYNTVIAAPIDLMVNQVSSTNSNQLNQYKQRIPFLVYLNIDGELLEPDISFKLDMPEDKQSVFGGTVYAQIIDLNSRESDLNKQVFALLLLERFISDDPLQSEGGYDVEDRARRSVSRLLTDQLSRLTDNINGINVDLGLESYQDYSTGSSRATTALELGVSKTLFKDKLEVKVAGNVNLEGAQQEGLSDYVGDLTLEYKITEDGRLRLTGFRRSDFDVISGEIIETGAGIIYVKDYNTFKELFRKRDDE